MRVPGCVLPSLTHSPSSHPPSLDPHTSTFLSPSPSHRSLPLVSYPPPHPLAFRPMDIASLPNTVTDPYAGRMDEPTRRRRRTTTLELEILEMEFARCDKPSICQRERISERISNTDIGGPGMNGREIQVWFQNKRQAIRRAQGAYPNCEPLSDRAKARLANEQLFGIKLGPPRNEQTTPPSSFTSPDDSGSSGKATWGFPTTASRHGMPTPTSIASRERRAQLVLSDLGDGHAEVMFTPTPLKPSSPPRMPAQITPIRTPLSRKIAARSASSPALFGSSASRVSSGLGSALRDSTNTFASSFTTPLASSSAKNLAALRSLKRSHFLITESRGTQKGDKVDAVLQPSKRRALPSKSASHHDLGRGKENIPPTLSIFTTPSTSGHRGQSNERHRAPVSATTASEPRPDEAQDEAAVVKVKSSRGVKDPTPERISKVIAVDRGAAAVQPLSPGGDRTPTHTAHKKMSAEECALSLVHLAHGM